MREKEGRWRVAVHSLSISLTLCTRCTRRRNEIEDDLQRGPLQRRSAVRFLRGRASWGRCMSLPEVRSVPIGALVTPVNQPGQSVWERTSPASDCLRGPTCRNPWPFRRISRCHRARAGVISSSQPSFVPSCPSYLEVNALQEYVDMQDDHTRREDSMCYVCDKTLFIADFCKPLRYCGLKRQLVPRDVREPSTVRPVTELQVQLYVVCHLTPIGPAPNYDST